ncbi:phosphohistidine phosphatase, partial [Yersinia enterocolitica]
MESLFEKISAYNIFNNIIPGAVFCYFFNLFFSVNLGGDGTAYNLCLFYFWGVFVSRIGSLLIEMLAIKIKFVKYAP